MCGCVANWEDGLAYIAALVEDLLFRSRIAETARLTNAVVRIVGTAEALGKEVSREEPSLVIVDLNAGPGALGAIRELRAAHPALRIIGYVSHVQTELAAEGRAAGCDEVMPRSKFTQELASLLLGRTS
jgi:DNA-binding NarL/FixJ family response regulator